MSIKSIKFAKLGRTRHIDHPAVAVLYNVACFTLDTAGRHAVHLKEAWVQGSGHTLAPRRRKVRQLKEERGVLFIR